MPAFLCISQHGSILIGTTARHTGRKRARIEPIPDMKEDPNAYDFF